MINNILLFIAGLVVLIFGADLLVRGSSRLAAAFGISPLVIGLTIVAIGTASPEIAVSIQAAMNGQGDLTLGNVLGSNIFNILFILGTTSIIVPVVIAEQIIRKDAPILLSISLLTFALAFDKNLSAVDGTILILLLVGYIIFVLKQSRAESKKVKKEYAEEYAEKEPRTTKNNIINIIFILIGLSFLVLGSNWLVDSAVQIAKLLGVSELVIGLTIVAIGTSLPEVATSIIAALKRESDIAVGNAIGSNIFNLLGVLGIGALIAPSGISVTENVINFDLLVMVFVSLVTLPIFYLDNRISRLEGSLLLIYYIIYITFTVLNAVESNGVSTLSLFASLFVPITFIILAVLAIQSARSRKNNLYD